MCAAHPTLPSLPRLPVNGFLPPSSPLYQPLVLELKCTAHLILTLTLPQASPCPALRKAAPFPPPGAPAPALRDERGLRAHMPPQCSSLM